MEFLVPETKKRFYVNEGQRLVKLVFEEGEDLIIFSPVAGQIMAFNHRLLQEPQRLLSDPLNTGHLLFMFPKKRTRTK